MSFFSKLFGGRPEGRPLEHPMDLHAFADRYAALLREAWPHARLAITHGARVADTRIEWSLPDGFKATNFLGNSYQRYLDAPQRLSEVLSDQLASAQAMQRSFVDGDSDEAGRANAVILPVLKTRGWHEIALQQARSIGAGAQIPFIVEPLAGDLVLTYVEDTPESMSFLSPTEAERRGLGREALHAQALNNLTKFLPELQIQGGEGRFVARLDRNYDASMVLLFDRWRERIDVQGDPVFAIAARDEVMVCGSDDAESLASLKDIAAQIEQSSAYNLSRALYVFREDRLQVLAD
ncbi:MULTISPECIES: hypothetical protein [Lysobacter]|uniref:hypothetical protein n=1 Tax=Lysobacter TaxID=68 RepID=UPI001F165DB1|nr:MULTISPECIES: hypothetical protein [Lysobacter]UJB20180.1 hypothetical protein L1A79_03550 [Lysobacter capsici]UJQ30706.1 hypothetical protein L2D09_11310 [Lysobacter gummosus]